MTANLDQCPEPKNFKLFLQGQLPVSDIENYEGHLGQCELCLETVEGLKVSDTFFDVAREALIEAD